MPKRISLEDPSSPEVDASIAKADTSDIIGLLEKIDWKLWELYKTGKRVEKYLEIENLEVGPEKK